ncbi:SXP-1 protein [Loa loa]|uniref:SXP-1 protein n=1 Tax=Loa loa TaxID=7209 RepID=A0A1I7VL79_LOALO|nr:SXP-1 protein [Loa loa]EFO21235.1 SXP-1 protein [Loa loa]
MPSITLSVNPTKIYCLILLSIGLITETLAQRRVEPPQQDALPGIPPFLDGAPPDVVQRFYDLVNNESKTTPEIEADVEKFIHKLGGNYTTRFEKFKEEVKRLNAEFETQRSKIVSNLSPEARKADAMLSDIAKDMHLTNRQKTERILTIMNSLSETVRNEILEALRPK